MRYRGLFIGIMVAAVLAPAAFGFEAYFADSAGKKIGKVAEGEIVYVAAIPEYVCEEFEADVRIFDFNTGAYVNAPGETFRQLTPGGPFFWVTAPGSSTRVTVQIGTRAGPGANAQTHVLGEITPAHVGWEGGAWAYVDEDILGVVNIEIASLPQHKGVARVNFEGELAATGNLIVGPQRIEGRLEGNDTLVLIVADKANIDTHQLKIEATPATLTVSPETCACYTPGPITITVVDEDENLDATAAEFVPIFVILNPGGWNPKDSRINNFHELLLRGGFDPARPDGHIDEPIRWYNIYDEPTTMRVSGGMVTSRFIQYPADWLSPDSSAGRVLFFAEETGKNTGEFTLTFADLADLEEKLGWATCEPGTTIAFYYLDPNDPSDFQVATLEVGPPPGSEAKFTDAAQSTIAEVGLGQGLYVKVDDPKANRDIRFPDQVVVHIADPGSLDSEWWILDETGENTGIFFSQEGMPLEPVWAAVGCYQLVLDDWALGARSGDNLYVRYNAVDYLSDYINLLGNKNPNEGVVVGLEAKVAFNQEHYQAGDEAWIFVTDSYYTGQIGFVGTDLLVITDSQGNVIETLTEVDRVPDTSARFYASLTLPDDVDGPIEVTYNRPSDLHPAQATDQAYVYPIRTAVSLWDGTFTEERFTFWLDETAIGIEVIDDAAAAEGYASVDVTLLGAGVAPTSATLVRVTTNSFRGTWTGTFAQAGRLTVTYVSPVTGRRVDAVAYVQPRWLAVYLDKLFYTHSYPEDDYVWPTVIDDFYAGQGRIAIGEETLTVTLSGVLLWTANSFERVAEAENEFTPDGVPVTIPPEQVGPFSVCYSANLANPAWGPLSALGLVAPGQVGPPVILTINVEGQGEVTLSPDPIAEWENMYFYDPDTEVELTAVAGAGWQFDRWEGDATGTDPTVLLTMDADKTVTAWFTEGVYEYTIQVSPHPPEGGTVSGGGTYAHGESVTVNAIPNTGWEFVIWTEEGVEVSTEASYTFTATGDRTLVAHFIPIGPTYTLTVQVEGQGTTSPAAGTHTYPAGTAVNLSATPATGWQFSHWTGPVANPSSATTTVTMDANKTVTAYFSQLPPPECVVVTHGYVDATVEVVIHVPERGYFFPGELAKVTVKDASNPPSVTVQVSGVGLISGTGIPSWPITLSKVGPGKYHGSFIVPVGTNESTKLIVAYGAYTDEAYALPPKLAVGFNHYTYDLRARVEIVVQDSTYAGEDRITGTQVLELRLNRPELGTTELVYTWNTLERVPGTKDKFRAWVKLPDWVTTGQLEARYIQPGTTNRPVAYAYVTPRLLMVELDRPDGGLTYSAGVPVEITVTDELAPGHIEGSDVLVLSVEGRIIWTWDSLDFLEGRVVVVTDPLPDDVPGGELLVSYRQPFPDYRESGALALVTPELPKGELALPPRIDEAAARNDPGEVSFHAVKVRSHPVFDGEVLTMSLLAKRDGQWHRVFAAPPTATLYLEVEDHDQNQNPGLAETVWGAWNKDGMGVLVDTAPIWPDLLDVALGMEGSSISGKPSTVKVFLWNLNTGKWERMDLKETGVNSGVFRSSTGVVLTELDAAYGHTIIGFYQDPSNHSDIAIVEIKVGDWVSEPVTPPVAPQVAFDRTTYNPGDLVTITVTDEKYAGEPAITGARVLVLTHATAGELKYWNSIPALAGTTNKFQVTFTLPADLAAGTITATYTDPEDVTRKATKTAQVVPVVSVVEGISVTPEVLTRDGVFTFKTMPDGAIAESIVVRIYDLTGRKVGETEGTDTDHVTWNPGSLRNGAYIWIAVVEDAEGVKTFKGFLYIKR